MSAGLLREVSLKLTPEELVRALPKDVNVVEEAASLLKDRFKNLSYEQCCLIVRRVWRTVSV